MRWFALTIFLSAFLLFQVQPLIGKYILPWFGASPSVWTTALLVFQVLLLAGYAYAHGSASVLSNRWQAYVHVVLLAVVALLLPITPAESWKPDGDSSLTWRIVLLLTVAVGGPFILLSSTSPLLQRWFTVTGVGRSPYRLYSISNAGSVLALLTYPFLIEPFIPLRLQTWVWSGGYAVFAVLASVCAWRLIKAAAHAPPEASGAASQDLPQPTARSRRRNPVVVAADEAPGVFQVLVWLSLAACGSILLLATTNRMTQNVPPVPFLFVLPLTLYLLTFIIAFDHERWYFRPLFYILLPGAIALAFRTMYQLEMDFEVQVACYSVVLFICCMCCHGELVRAKPYPAHLTLFYLMVSAGGAIGGALVALLAPRIFNAYWEYEIGIILSYMLIAFLAARNLWRTPAGGTHKAGPPGNKKLDQRRGKQRVGGEERACPARNRLRSFGLGGILLVTVGLGTFCVVNNWEVFKNYTDNPGLLARSRNFYGILEVTESETETSERHKYSLLHGTVRHGFQYRHPQRRAVATAYYGNRSGVGLTLRHHPLRKVPDRQFRVGVIGLGAGTISSYINDRDVMTTYDKKVNEFIRYYEINPEVLALAEKYFTFLLDARERGADQDVYLGDARIVMEGQLERGQAQNFDVLVVDAFSGDAIPMHLLTRECFKLYIQHIHPEGVLAFNISSHHLNLYPVIHTLAQQHGKQACFIRHVRDLQDNSASSWVLVTDNQAFLLSKVIREARTPVGEEENKKVEWTDDFCSLFQVLK